MRHDERQSIGSGKNGLIIMDGEVYMYLYGFMMPFYDDVSGWMMNGARNLRDHTDP